jgi:hypothetical protein
MDQRAHKSNQTGAPRHGSPRIKVRAYMAAIKRKTDLGECHLGSAEPLDRPNLDGLSSKCILT